jgi:anaerobic selenocysteine-containing dehydrogenase
MSETQLHYRACNLCEALCGLEIEYKGKEIIAIRGDKNDPFSHGHICPKATALEDVHKDPDRLRQPVRRTENGWEKITWDEAFDEVERGIKSVQEKYGRDAVGVYLGNPNVHHTGSLLYGAPFIRSLLTKNRFSATSVDQLPHHFAAFFMFGHQLLIPVPDVDRTQFMLILGANPLESNGSLMTAGGIERRLKAIQARGGKIVVVDPRKTLTAKMADEHFFIKPAMDAFLLAAMIHTLYEENLVNLGRLAQFTDNVEAVRDAVADFSAETVAETIGIEAEAIRQLARDFANAESAVCYARMGLSTQIFGGLSNWLVNVLNIITGNFDEVGGAMFTSPAFDWVRFGGQGKYGRWNSRVRGRPEFAGELPVSVLGEEILTEGEGQIKAMITNAGNPVLSTPNGQQLDKAFAGLAFMVSIDIYINETTRHANIILPPTTGLETEHYDVAFHALAVQNTAKYSEPLFKPEEGQLHDWEILRELRKRMEKGTKYESKKDIFKFFNLHRLIDLALRLGEYGSWGGRLLKRGGLSLKKLKENPHGIDFGGLVSVLPNRLPNGRIELAPKTILEDIPRLKADLKNSQNAQENGFNLLLIGRRDIRTNNSWMHNSERLVKGKNRCTLLMNPEDAQSLNLENAQDVCIESRVGEILIPLEISETVMRGVVSIPHGWGHGREGIQLSVAAQNAGVSINDLTDDQQIDELTGNAAFSGVAVKVKR